MGLASEYPSVVGIYRSQSVLVYDAHFKPIDSVPDGSPVKVIRLITGPDHVEYYLLVSAAWAHNTTDRAYVRASAVRIVDNPWDEIPHHGRLQTRMRLAIAGVRRAARRHETAGGQDDQSDGETT